RTFPWPVWRSEVQAEQERIARCRHARDLACGVLAEEVGHVADFIHVHVAVPQVGLAVSREGQWVPEVIGAAPANAPEMLVAVLQRAVFVDGTEVPLADE